MSATLPLIILAGNAGSGKDAFGSFLAKASNGTTLAQADAMKRFVMANFYVDPECLWGASALRSTLIPTKLLDATGTWNTGGEAGELLIRLGIDRVEQWYQDHIWHNKEVTVRHLLQTFGTELGRNFDHDLWNNIAIENLMKVLTEGRKYDSRLGLGETKGHWEYAQMGIITDGRFRNEVLNIKKINGVAVRIFNVKQVQANLAKGIKDTHPSELELASIPPSWYNHVVFNQMEGLDKLEGQAHRLLLTL